MNNEVLASLIAPVTVFLVVAAFSFFLRGVIFRSLEGLASKTDSILDDIVLQSLKLPSIFLFTALSIYLAAIVSNLPQKVNLIVTNMLFIMVVISGILIVAHFISGITRKLLSKAGSRMTGLSDTVVRGVVYFVGGLIIMGELGISITPIITTLGIGGLAVALALQDSLSNFFAGIHLVLENPVRVGDFVKLDNGERGEVVDIGWRTTRIKVYGNNMLIIPNSKLAESTIKNYSIYEKKMGLRIPIGVGYESDIDLVERVVMDELKQASPEVEGLLDDPASQLIFMPGFGESSLDFTLVCYVRTYNDQYEVQNVLRRRIFKRFQKEGINIPFPIRTVYMKGND